MATSPYRKCHYCKATDQQFERRRSFERRAWTLFKNSGRMCCPNCQRKGREDERLATVQRIIDAHPELLRENTNPQLEISE